jgi:Uma2 family endonuclease
MEQGITGAPNLCVEVTSPGSTAADRKREFELYEKHGVPEYWIVESSGGILEVYRLDGSGRFTRSGACGSGETISPATPPAVSGYGGTQ